MSAHTIRTITNEDKDAVETTAMVLPAPKNVLKVEYKFELDSADFWDPIHHRDDDAQIPRCLGDEKSEKGLQYDGKIDGEDLPSTAAPQLSGLDETGKFPRNVTIALTASFCPNLFFVNVLAVSTAHAREAYFAKNKDYQFGIAGAAQQGFRDIFEYQTGTKTLAVVREQKITGGSGEYGSYSYNASCKDRQTTTFDINLSSTSRVEVSFDDENKPFGKIKGSTIVTAVLDDPGAFAEMRELLNKESIRKALQGHCKAELTYHAFESSPPSQYNPSKSVAKGILLGTAIVLGLAALTALAVYIVVASHGAALPIVLKGAAILWTSLAAKFALAGGFIAFLGLSGGLKACWDKQKHEKALRSAKQQAPTSITRAPSVLALGGALASSTRQSSPHSSPPPASPAELK